MSSVSLEQLRRYAIARSLFAPTTLARAIRKLGFLQADPIRAPARAQDLTLRLRVKNYRAGMLERRYPQLGVEEDFFINYGFVPHSQQALMHPRGSTRRGGWDRATQKRAAQLLAFVRERGAVHPREVERHFGLGSVTNYWGGSSHATTHLLDNMHYHGLLRVVRRDGGVRIYAAQTPWPAARSAAERRERVDALVDLVVNLYAPLPRTSFHMLVSRLRYAVPQWRAELKPALARARERLAHARVGDVDWYWPRAERPTSVRHAGLEAERERVHLLSPFDPVVWDRRRFELFWNWPYRFEAYTPASKRKLGYYALPLLWGERIVGWGNLKWSGGELSADFGFVEGRPSDAAFERELAAELARVRAFLGDDA